MFRHKVEKTSSTEFLQVDTTNILFICGVLAGLDKVIERRGKGSSIGFEPKVKL